MRISDWSSDVCSSDLQRASGGGFNRASGTRIIEAKASAVSLGSKGRGDVAVGDRVFHAKFGYGHIALIEGNKLEIDFDHSGRKRVDRTSTRLNSSHYCATRMPSSS